MYLQGIGKERIADILNEEGVPKKRDTKRWNQRMISYILINERYMGDALLQKFYTTDTLPYKKRPNKGEKAKYYVEDAGPAIVSKEVFEAAKALSQKRACLTEHHANHTLYLNSNVLLSKVRQSISKINSQRKTILDFIHNRAIRL